MVVHFLQRFLLHRSSNKSIRQKPSHQYTTQL
nr:MAG TPA: hypothetical protein [Bacteriophage sp.]